MKAWKIEYDKLISSKPVVLTEEEQTWDATNDFEILGNKFYSMKWHSNVPGSGAPEAVIIGGIQSMENMGYDVSSLEELIPIGQKAYEDNDHETMIRVTCEIFAQLETLPKLHEHPFHQYQVYETFTQYEKSVKFPKAIKVKYDDQELFERTYHGWLAQITGGAFGTAIEGYTKAQLKKAFGKIDSYIRTPNTYNDDITYELAFLRAYLKTGKQITSKDVALAWVEMVPFGWSAEEIALKNIQAGIMPPLSGYFNNPYREWIGAQMRGAICGMVAPGDPHEAARLAWIDAVVSHHNNGVLGEVFNAILVSLSYVENDVLKILKATIELMPKDSEYYHIVKTAYDACVASKTWEEAWDVLEPQYMHYNWVHAYPNAGAEVVALYFGKGHYDETMHIVGSVGYDVDCNAAQIITMIGIIDNKVPSKWSDPIGENVDTYCRSPKKTTITELTKQTMEAIKKYY